MSELQDQVKARVKYVRELEAEVKRLRTALQKIADQDFDDGLGHDATVLSGFAWTVLAPES